MLYLFISFWLISLCIIGSRFIHFTRTDSNTFFLWLSNIPLYKCTTTSLSIHLFPCPGYCKYCCSELWGTCVFPNCGFSQCMCWVVGLLGHMVDLFLVFKGISILFSIMAVSVYIPTNSAGGFPFLCILSSIYYLYIFWWWPCWLVWGHASL